MDLFNTIVKRTLTVPATLPDVDGNAEKVVRQFDIALLSVGFKASRQLLDYLTNRNPVIVSNYCHEVITAVKELKGDDVKHNVYFIDFPKNVPDTLDFWIECIVDALDQGVKPEIIGGAVNLLSLPKYGKYLHSYEEMLTHHDVFVDNVDKIILHLGKPLAESANDLFKSLCGSNVPLKESDRDLLAELAEVCDDVPYITVRENKAVVNAVRFNNGQDVVADTPTDFLRLAAALSNSDVTLETNSKFTSWKRSDRKRFAVQLDKISKFEDVLPYAEQWKRLSERLHPYEFKGLSNVDKLFTTARGESNVRSFNSQVDKAFNTNILKTLRLLATNPGYLVRNVDRLLNTDDIGAARVAETLVDVIPQVNSRVLLSLRQHLQNRNNIDTRIFINRQGKTWVQPETRQPLYDVDIINNVLDKEIFSRTPKYVYDPAVLSVALPLSEKGNANGYMVLPRGSIQKVDDGILRFFCYWKESEQRTDFDLSALMLDGKFTNAGHISYTNLTSVGGVHSGDITSAPRGASEFIDITLNKINAKYVLPQVNIYSGESFTEVEQSYFGFMHRTAEQKGKPFEAATVKNRSDLRGNGRVALPVAFYKDDDQWYAKWLNIYQKGYGNFNTVENNKMSTALLTKSIVNYDYLNVGYLMKNGKLHDGVMSKDSIYVGLTVPEGLPEGVKTITLSNLHELI